MKMTKEKMEAIREMSQKISNAELCMLINMCSNRFLVFYGTCKLENVGLLSELSHVSHNGGVLQLNAEAAGFSEGARL
jgi:hypothetical protein